MNDRRRWWIVLVGPTKWFRQLGERFADPSFEVREIRWDQGGKSHSAWALSTERLNESPNVETARTAAYADVGVLSGLAGLFWSGIPPVTAISVLGIRDGMFTEGAIMAIPGAAILYGSSGSEDLLLEASPRGLRLRSGIAASLSSPRLSLALEVYGREPPNWGSMYKVVELAEKELGVDSVVDLAQVSKGFLERFGATANRPTLGGIDARHAVEAGDAPQPISISSAEQMCRRLLTNWLVLAANSGNSHPGA